MTYEMIQDKLKTLQERVRQLDTWAVMQVTIFPDLGPMVFGGIMGLRATGPTIDEAFDAFDKALTALESRDRHLSETIGAPMPEHA